MTLKGDYSSATSYSAGDVVRFGNMAYKAKESVTGIPPVDTIRWERLPQFMWDAVDMILDAIDEDLVLEKATADATAAKGDIKSGKTAYVNGSKITGNYSPSATISNGSQKTTSKTVSPGTYAQGDTLTTLAKPSSEIWDTSSLQCTVTGSDELSGKVGVSTSTTAITVVASSAVTTTHSNQVTIKYTPKYIATVS